jgi:hypothetical protein
MKNEENKCCERIYCFVTIHAETVDFSDTTISTCDGLFAGVQFFKYGLRIRVVAHFGLQILAFFQINVIKIDLKS